MVGWGWGFECQKRLLSSYVVNIILYIYFIAEDIHLRAFIQCNNALRGMVLINTKMDTNQPQNELNIISRLSKARWR